MSNSILANHVRSKEKRNDAKLIVLALIVNQHGFLKYSDIFEGNTTDHETLELVINKLNKKVRYQGKQKPIIVMDAGISTEGNICLPAPPWVRLYVRNTLQVVKVRCRYHPITRKH